MKNLNNTNGAIVLGFLKRLMMFYLTFAIAVVMLPVGIIYWIFREQTQNGVWQSWFAWRPVKLKNINKYVWLKNIERFESWIDYGEYSHRNVLFRLPEKQPEINNN